MTSLELAVVESEDLDDSDEELVGLAEEDVESDDEDDDSTCPPGHLLLGGALHDVPSQIGYSLSHSGVYVFPSGEP